MRTTREPVTVGGWYEHTDGTVGRYGWWDGQPHLIVVVASWESVKAYDSDDDWEPGDPWDPPPRKRKD